MNIITTTVELNQEEAEVLGCLNEDNEFCYAYDSIMWRTEIDDRKKVEKIIKRLRGLELVEYVRGLMTEDGDVAGSGFCRTEKGNLVVNSIREIDGL